MLFRPNPNGASYFMLIEKSGFEIDFDESKMKMKRKVL